MKLDERIRLALAGGLGLLANGVLILALGYWRSAQEGPAWLAAALRDLAPDSAGLLILILYVIFMALALAEIPLMTLALRAMRRSPSRPARLTIWAAGIFVFFAAVYAGLFVLLTGRLDLGITISASGILRLMAVALFVVGFRQPAA